MDKLKCFMDISRGVDHRELRVNVSKMEFATFPPESPPTISLGRLGTMFSRDPSLCGSRLELAKKGIREHYI